MDKYTQYYNVSYNGLRSAVTQALHESLEYNLKSTINNLNNKSVLSINSSGKILNALNEINTSNSITGSIAVLTDRLKNLLQVSDLIKGCQDYAKQLLDLEPKIYKDVPKEVSEINEDGEEVFSTIWVKEKDWEVINQMEKIKGFIAEKETKIDEILAN